MTVCMGFLALVIDLGNARQFRRQAQAGADAAALAGAHELTTPSWTWGSVTTQVQTYAANNFGTPSAGWNGCADPQALPYTPDVTNTGTCISSDSSSNPSKIRVRLPPKAVRTAFAGAIGVSATSVSAAATGAVVTSTAPCVLCVFSPTASPALSGSGNGKFNISGGGIVVNSTASVAASLTGHALAAATGIGGPAAPAGFQTSGGASYSPAPINQPAVANPLAGLPQCPGAGTPSPCPTASFPNVSVNGSGATQTLSPGIYGSISTTSGGSLGMNPGTYIITSSFSISGNGSLQAAGVTLYFACSAYPTPCSAGQSGASLSLSGNGSMNLSPPTSGPFQGLAVFFDTNNTASSSITGNGGTVLTGTVYMKSAPLTITGNGSVSSLNSVVLADKVTVSGNGDLSLSYNAAANQNAPIRAVGLSQ
jgi:hypothetical protein